MTDNALYKDKRDLTLHRSVIHDLARESGLPEPVVTEIYEQNLSYLKKTARVKDYLPILTRRMVKENLRYRH